MSRQSLSDLATLVRTKLQLKEHMLEHSQRVNDHAACVAAPETQKHHGTRKGGSKDAWTRPTVPFGLYGTSGQGG